MPHTTDDIAATLEITTGRGWLRRLRRVLILVVLLLGGGYGLLHFLTVKAEAPPEFRVQETSIGDITVTVTATGTLEPTNEVEVGSEISGLIDDVLVDYNDYVKVGQTLAQVNTDKLRATVLQSKAALLTAQAKVDDARVDLDETDKELKRLRQVHERTNGQLPSQQEMDTAEAARQRAEVALASAQAEVARAEATLEYDETNLSKAVIKSPINGVVLTRLVDPGQTIAASFQAPALFTIAEDLRRMELHVDVDEADVGQVQEGQEALFTVDAYPERSFPGKISELYYAASETDGVVTYEAVLTVDNSELLLRPGMTATAEIIVQAVRNAVLVPNAALRFQPSPPGEREAGGPPEESFINRLLPRPPRRDSSRPRPAPEIPAEDGDARVWVLQGNHPVPVSFKPGCSDGKVTELVSGELAPGVSLVVGVVKESS